MRKLTTIMLLLLAVMVQAQVTHVTLTCYQPVKAQTNSKPLKTADGSDIHLGKLKQGKLRWCAVSRDLLYLFPKDKPKRVWIEGYGEYEVHDIMNRRHHHRIDLLLHPKDSKRISIKNVKVRII